jgi:hypothetical protein
MITTTARPRKRNSINRRGSHKARTQAGITGGLLGRDDQRFLQWRSLRGIALASGVARLGLVTYR